MSKNSKIAVFVLAFLLLLGFFWYPSYKIRQAEKTKMALGSKENELDQLIVKDHDCSKVVDVATAYLRSNAGSSRVWSALGSCQFDLGKFDDAKVSFQKVLSLDPENVAAKNYLKQMEFKAGEVVVTASETLFDKTQFESRMGLNFDNILTFVKAVEKPSSITEYLLASYTSSKSLNDTVSSLKGALKKANIDFVSSQTSASAIISSTNNDKERKIIMIKKVSGPLIKVDMNYQKLTN